MVDSHSGDNGCFLSYSGYRGKRIFQRFFCGGHFGRPERFFQAHSIDFNPSDQYLDTRFFYIHHQCGFAQSGLGCYIGLCGARILVGGFRRSDYQRGELVVEFVYQ